MTRWIITLALVGAIASACFLAGIAYSEIIRNTIKEEATNIVRTQFNEALREVCGSLKMVPNVYPGDLLYDKSSIGEFISK